MSSIFNEKELNECREKTVKDILELLQHNDKVACNRYTGFGKSYYIVRNLVQQLNDKVLIIVPNAALYMQYKELFKNNKNVRLLTYCILKNKTNEIIKRNYSDFKYIICDECHHLGNNKWKNEFDRFNNIVKAKVIGLTATPTRGDSVDVIDTYFNGVQVEPLELIDGISNGFVPKIKYIIAYAEIEDKYDKRLSEIDRYYIRNLLKVPNILNKYIDKERLKNNLKILVYVPQIKYIDEAMNKCKEWFEELYPNKNINLYTINSSLKKSKAKILRMFKENTNKDDIDIMVSVNMLTEGLHLPSIGVEIMLRKTASPVVYFQQVGRTINCQQPLVFDLINNSKHLYQMKKEYKINEDKTKWGCNNHRAKVMFDQCVELYDETKEIEDILCNYRSNNYIQKIFEQNMDYITNNPDKLTYAKLAQKFDINVSSFLGYIKRHNIKIKNNPICTGITDKIKENIEYIESNPDKLTKLELSKKLNIPYNAFNTAIKRLDIHIANTVSNKDKYLVQKQNIDNNIDYIKNKLNKHSASDVAKEFDVSSRLLIRYLQTKHNYVYKDVNTTRYKQLDLDYIKSNPDNLTITQLAHKFGYKNSTSLSSNLRRKGIKTISFMGGELEIANTTSDTILDIIRSNENYIRKNKNNESTRDMSEKFNIGYSTFKQALSSLGIPLPVKHSPLQLFINNNLDYIKDNSNKYTISGMASKLMSLEGGNKFSRTGISDYLRKLKDVQFLTK